MTASEPIYCAECGRLALTAIDGVALCGDCVVARSESEPVEQLERHSSPLYMVVDPDAEPPQPVYFE